MRRSHLDGSAPGIRRDTRLIGVALALALLGGGCDGAGTTQPETVVVNVAPVAFSLAPGQSQVLAAAVVGSTNTTVLWQSSAPALASVTAAGVVTAVSPGTATITATSQAAPASSSSAVVTVLVPVIFLIAPATSSISVGASQQLTATVSGLANSGVIWNSTAPAVASVDQSGRVTGIGPGVATIVATSSADATRTASAQITVVAPVAVQVAPTSITVRVGEAQSLSAAVTGSSNTAVTWTTSDATVATVDQAGKVTGVKSGSATVTATSVADPTRAASATVTVTPAVSSATRILVQKNPIASAVSAGSTNTIIAWLMDSSNNRVAEAGQVIDWSTTDPGGRLTPTSSVTDASGSATTTYTPGTTPYFHTITATAQLRGYSGALPVFVTGPPRATLDSVTLSIDAAGGGGGEQLGIVSVSGPGNVGGLATLYGYEYSTNAAFANATTEFPDPNGGFGPDTSNIRVGARIPSRVVSKFGPDTTYIRVILQNSAGTIRTNALYVTTPDAPSNVRATLGSDHIMTVSWSHSGVNLNQGFTVRRRAIDSQTWFTIDSPNSRRNTGSFVPANERSVVDSGFDVRTTQTWIYEVAAYNAVGSKSATTEITTARLEPPSAVALGAVTPTSITITWKDNSSTESGFTIGLQGGSGSYGYIGQTPANVTTFTYTIPPLNPPGTTYTIQVSAFVPAMTNGNYAGRVSIPSATVQVTP